MIDIYLVTNLQNGLRYVGITSVGFHRRWRQHLAKAANGAKLKLHCAIRSFATDVWSVHCLDTSTSLDEAKFKEQIYIAEFRSNEDGAGYNATAGGQGALGYKHTETAKSKMRAAHCANPRKQSAENVARFTALIRSPRSVKHRAGIGKALAGKVKSDTHRNALSSATTAAWKENRAKYVEARVKRSAADVIALGPRVPSNPPNIKSLEQLRLYEVLSKGQMTRADLYALGFSSKTIGRLRDKKLISITRQKNPT